jgi:hypothetical protein
MGQLEFKHLVLEGNSQRDKGCRSLKLAAHL